jgi:hypothetical protein
LLAGSWPVVISMAGMGRTFHADGKAESLAGWRRWVWGCVSVL